MVLSFKPSFRASGPLELFLKLDRTNLEAFIKQRKSVSKCASTEIDYFRKVFFFELFDEFVYRVVGKRLVVTECTKSV
jgi:hypothetical protein